MIFAHTLEQVMSGKKTQTRRIAKPGEHFITHEWNQPKRVSRVTENRVTSRFKVGYTYPVQLGRGVASVGRIVITDIRCADRAGDISEEDAQAEGFEPYETYCAQPGESHLQMPDRLVSAREQFLATYQAINGKRALDKPCWVIEFRLITGEEKEAPAHV